MPPLISPAASTSGQVEGVSGFILLEVLVALSLVVSSWMVLGNTYQQMLLQLSQLQAQKERIKKEIDQHEIALLISVQPQNVSQQLRKSLNESVGMPRRSRPISDIGGAAHQKQR
jgi:hypothetical protein